MEGNRVLMATPCSVGTAKDPTPSGSWRIFNKDYRHRRVSNPGAGYPMTYWCEFKPSYGLHWGYIKPYPCTHGCIRMHENLSPKFYRLVKIGTPVQIAQSQREDARYADIPLPPDAGPLDDYDSSLDLSDWYFHRHKTPEFVENR